MSPQFVAPYVKSNKNDVDDADAIAEAGGPSRRIDNAARRTIARELGHDRSSILSVYVGN